MTRYDDSIARAKREHGDRFDDSDLVPTFRPFFDSGARIRVRSADGYTRTGTVGKTTGWRPAFLLMHRSNAVGSWDVLGPMDVVVAVKRGRHYVDVRGVTA